MSRLDELIAELCPNGVKYKTLGEICSYAKERIDATLLNKDNYVGVDNLLPNKKEKHFQIMFRQRGVLLNLRKIIF